MMFKEQPEFHPNSRCFAYDDNALVGYMSFTGQGDFVSLGYPWVLPGYEGELQDELFERVYSFAVSEQYGGKTLAQRFRSQWEEQIQYFISKGFEIKGRSPILSAKLPREQEKSQESPSIDIVIKNAFEFEKWKQLKTLKTGTTEEEILMMQQYYHSVDFDYSMECRIHDVPAAYFGVTIREDTGFSEILAAEFNNKYVVHFSEVMKALEQESYTRGARTLSISESFVPENKLDGYNVVTEDLMLMKHV